MTHRVASAAGGILLWAITAGAQFQPDWKIQHYELQYEILPSERIYRGTATLKLRNVSKSSRGEVTLALYRLQDVERIEDVAGRPLRMRAGVVKAPDWLGFQAVEIRINLPDLVPPGEAVTVRVRHSGPMLGYQEVKRYTKDHIGEDFSLLRNDTLAYPMLGPVTDRDISGNLAAQIVEGWTFRLEVTVPKPLIVAASGREVRRTAVDANRWRYEFIGVLPTWRIDIAAANYQVVERPQKGLKVYIFPQDIAVAEAAMYVMAKTTETFAEWFGPVPGAVYTLIEIPDGYGSQAGTSYFLQTRDMLNTRSDLPDLAHEIAHAWNVPSREDRSSRFLDEAFATYFQALIDDVLKEPGANQHRLEEYRRGYLRELEKHPEWGSVAIADYGRRDLTELSYLKGPWALAVLDSIVGPEAFRKAVRTFLARYQTSGATPAEFRAVAEEVSGRALDRFWMEWIEEGQPSTALLLELSSPSEMAARYR